MTTSIDLTLGNPLTCISGTVTDSTGQFISGLQGKVYSDNCFSEFKTKSNGLYEVKGLKEGIYDLVIWQNKKELYTKENIQINEGEIKNLDIVLKTEVNSIQSRQEKK